MKHRKQITVLLLAWVLLLCMPVKATAGSTTITTTVPSHVSLTVEVTGKGSVRIGTHRIRTSQTVSVPRSEQVKIYLRPNYGYEVESVLLDGTDITSQIKNDTLILDTVFADQTLSVTFVRSESQCPNPDLPDTGHPVQNPFQVWMETVMEIIRWMCWNT